MPATATVTVIMVTVSALEPERRTPGALTATQAQRLSVSNWEGSELVAKAQDVMVLLHT
jgi:hypothetical protein